MIWAIIENGIVVNTIVADQKFIKKNFPEAIEITDSEIGINWLYDGTVFTAPPVIIEEVNESISE